MNTHVKAAGVLVMLGLGAIIATRLLLPLWQEHNQKTSSDARSIQGTIHLAMDSWVGYQPLCSQQMKTRMRQAGYILDCINDQGDYPGRMGKLKSGEYQMAVATVDSYLLNGASQEFPGVIVAVLDESFGGDAIVAWQDTVENLDSLKRQDDIRVALTPDSPSEHLAKAAAVHFDIPALRGRDTSWLVATKGSGEALQKLLDREVPVAVLWEPDVSRALEKKGITKLLGTEVTARLVVDILLAGREFSQENPKAVKALLSNYFYTLKYFRDHPDKLRDELRESTGLDGDQVDNMLGGVRWSSLTDNAKQWFGVASTFGSIPEEGLIETIEGAVRILIGSGDFSASPLSDNNPYRITNSSFVSDLFKGSLTAGQFQGGEGKTLPSAAEKKRSFTRLSEAQWTQLQEVGTLQVRPILFQSGTAALSMQGKLELDKAAESLQHYPDFRVLVKGHTSIQGDPAANKQLSLARAEAVKRYLIVTHDLDEQRVRTQGLGGTQPLARQPGESARAYSYRLPRVEMVLLSEVL